MSHQEIPALIFYLLLKELYLPQDQIYTNKFCILFIEGHLGREARDLSCERTVNNRVVEYSFSLYLILLFIRFAITFPFASPPQLLEEPSEGDGGCGPCTQEKSICGGNVSVDGIFPGS